ncbi:E3 ubiquitin-protein ligase TRAIP [Smittium mucronatum]|uniref:E3 ubiquitin-protein ligase TRAIP n=1 Tax=Smittium mucronatum TaxID=133383 RepID=A0A1R0H004_9FUNG|nr:E3 ubiquitin-protein ligase TRAIP [Smittium mucronatum]
MSCAICFQTWIPAFIEKNNSNFLVESFNSSDKAPESASLGLDLTDNGISPNTTSSNTIKSQLDARSASFRRAEARSESLVIDKFPDIDIEQAAALSCGHVFHANCVQKWLVHKRCCPTCRADQKTNQQPIPLFIDFGIESIYDSAVSSKSISSLTTDLDSSLPFESDLSDSMLLETYKKILHDRNDDLLEIMASSSSIEDSYKEKLAQSDSKYNECLSNLATTKAKLISKKESNKSLTAKLIKQNKEIEQMIKRHQYAIVNTENMSRQISVLKSEISDLKASLKTLDFYKYGLVEARKMNTSLVSKLSKYRRASQRRKISQVLRPDHQISDCSSSEDLTHTPSQSTFTPGPDLDLSTFTNQHLSDTIPSPGPSPSSSPNPSPQKKLKLNANVSTSNPLEISRGSLVPTTFKPSLFKNSPSLKLSLDSLSLKPPISTTNTYSKSKIRLPNDHSTPNTRSDSKNNCESTSKPSLNPFEINSQPPLKKSRPGK